MGDSIKLILAIIGLAGSIWAWFSRADLDRKKKIADEDIKIDACNNADDVLLELDRLRNKPSNRP